MAANVPKAAVTHIVKRGLSSPPPPHFMGPHAGEHADQARVMWKRLSFVGFGVMGVCMVYNYMVHMEHEKHWHQPEWVPYSYLAIRKKKFPWGDGNHSLFHNPRTNALPDGYETV